MLLAAACTPPAVQPTPPTPSWREPDCPPPTSQPVAGRVLQRGPGCTELWLDARVRSPVARPSDLPLVARGERSFEDLVAQGDDAWNFVAQLEGEPFGLPTELMDAFLGNASGEDVHAVFNLLEDRWKTGLVHIQGEFLPRGLVEVRAPEPLVTQNCSACHNGVVKGRLIQGVGNKWYNQRAIIEFTRGLMEDGIPAPGENADLEARLRRQREKLERYDSLYGQGCADLAPGMITAARIWEISSKLLADPAQLQDPAQASRFLCGATKPPPLNTVRFRNLLFWDGAVGTTFVTHWPMFDFFGFDDYARWEAKIATPDIQAMDAFIIFATPSPSWEEIMGTPIDAAMAARGMALFHQDNSCASCHGQYRQDGMLHAFTPSITPLADIGTDQERAIAATDEVLQEFRQYNWAQVPRLDFPGAFGPGYAPTPLCSTFLNFPYLHTAGVANLMELLTPEDQRSLSWWQSDVTNDQLVGYFTTASPPDVSGTTPPARLLQRTLRFELVAGHSGDAYGTSLSTAQKFDLLEYVKSLRCPEEPRAAR